MSWLFSLLRFSMRRKSMNFADFEKLMLAGINQSQATGEIVCLSFTDADLGNIPEATDESATEGNEVEDDDDDFGGNFPLSVEYGDDEGEPTYIESEDY
jgi:hypothetical protein